eukprot:Ihof_evm2s831 gene=Ihof_evmTU2s831
MIEGKQGAAKAKEQDALSKQLEAIEKAAMSSYADDVADNPSLAKDTLYTQHLQDQKEKEMAKKTEKKEESKPKPVSPPPPPKPKPIKRDRTTGLGQWQSVEVSQEEEARLKEIQDQLEEKREKEK